MIAFYRMAFSVLLLAIPMVWRRPKRPANRDVALAALSGVFLAAHFATWFFSLQLTSIASSTVLVTIHPFIILLFGFLAWGERLRPAGIIGVIGATLGGALVGWGDFRLDIRALQGDLLAFLGAVTVSGYFLIGRQLRQRMDAVSYSLVAYTSAAVLLLAAALAWHNPLTGFAPVNWWLFIGLAIFPTIFGHTLFNWALKYVPASVVSVNVLGEPIGASVLAWAIWGTAPQPLTMVGGGLILTGVALFVRSQQGSSKPRNLVDENG